MKTRLPPLAALAFLAVCLLGLFAWPGCASTGAAADPAVIQKILDGTVPRTFRGPAHVYHKNAYVDFDLRFADLRYEDGRWQWAAFSYVRNGRMSHGTIHLGDPAAR